MKRKLIFAGLLVCGLALSEAVAQQESCHAVSATASFADLGNDQQFVEAHEEPLAKAITHQLGETITFNTPDGKQASGYFIAARKPSKYYLLVIHEWWGLNDYIRQESEKLYEQLGINVLALDMYEGKVAEKREEAAQLMQSVQKERAEAIIRGAIAHAGKKAKIFTIGWCFGGSWSLQAAILAGKQAAGCVMYYGMPEKDVNRLKLLKTDVLGIFASQEQWISPAVVKEFEENMKKANKKLIVKSFDAEHAFANPSNPRYNKVFAEEAHRLTVAFFKERM